MYVYDEQKIEKEKRKTRLFIFRNSLMYVIIPIIIGFLKINKNRIIFEFDEKTHENSEGQHIVFYLDNEIVGGGEIRQSKKYRGK